MQQPNQIEDLRRKIRNLQYVLYTSCFAAFLFAIFSIMVFFFQLFAVPNVVQANSFELIGANGEVIALIAPTDDGDGVVNLFNSSGQLGTIVSSSSLDVLGPDGESVAGIGTTDDGDGAVVLFNGARGEVIATIGPTEYGDGVVNLFNRSGQLGAIVGPAPSGDYVVNVFSRFGSISNSLD